MSVASDLAVLYADTFLTCPVRAESVLARGFFTETSGVETDADGQPVQTQVRVLTLLAGALPLAIDGIVAVGAVGAVTMLDAVTYRVRDIRSVSDGLETEYVITRVPR